MTTLRSIPRIWAILLFVAGLATAVTASPVDELTRRLPDDLLFFVATSGGDALKGDMDGSVLGRIWNDPGTQAFCTSIESGLIESIQDQNVADSSVPAVVRTMLDYCRLVLQRPIVIGLAQGQAANGPPACLFAIVDAGDRKAALEELVTRAETTLGEQEVVDVQIGSLALRRLRDDDSIPCYWGWADNYLVVAVNDAHGVVAEHLAAPREAILPQWEQVAGHGDALAAYYDHARSLNVIEAVAAEEGGAAVFQTVKAVLADLGLANVGTAVARAGFAGSDLVSGVYVQVPQPRTGLLAALGPVEASAAGTADARAVSVFALNCNLAAVFDVAMKTIRTAAPEKDYARMQQSLGDFESDAGVSIRAGLLKSLAGPSLICVFPLGKMLEAPTGGAVVVAELADVESFEQTMSAIAEWAATEDEGSLLIGSQTDEAGRTIHIWSDPGLALMGWMPSWCIVEGQLVFGSTTALCKLGIAQITPKDDTTGSLLTTEAYQRATTGLPDDLFGLRYMDSQVQFSQAMIQMRQVWPTLAMAMAQEGIRLPLALPSFDYALQDVPPACEYGRLTPEGLYWHYQGPGLETSLTGVAGASLGMGILMPALARVRQLAFRMTSGENLVVVGKVCLSYAKGHEGKLPPSLGRLVIRGELADACLESKLRPDDFHGASYLYVAGQTMQMSGQNVLAYENPAYSIDGVNVLFLDGHVEFMNPDAFREALQATCERLDRDMPEIEFAGQ